MIMLDHSINQCYHTIIVLMNFNGLKLISDVFYIITIPYILKAC